MKSEAYYSNGKLHNDNGPAHIIYYENGKVKSESYWINHNNDNSQAFVGFYDNGNKQSEKYRFNGFIALLL